MRLDEACEKVFARHETFHPRYGWLKKAVDATSAPGDIFNSPDAVVTLGVGKNMVRSIRHWGLAFKVLERDPESSARRPVLRPSELGNAWFGPDGVDPYMELPGTHWFLHWQLLAPRSQAPVWWTAFNEFPAVEFTEEELAQFTLDRMGDFGSPHAGSVKKDVKLLLRMYAAGHSVRATFEERVDAPFRELGLILPSVHEDHDFRFNVGAKPSLPARVFAACVLDFAARLDESSRTVSVSKVLVEPGSPGRAFKLTDATTIDLLEMASKESSAFDLGVSAGMPQLVLTDAPGSAAACLLREHYLDYGAPDLKWRPETTGAVA
jgi:hypothetical protein